jgi:DNA-binding response OmpR family regulator
VGSDREKFGKERRAGRSPAATLVGVRVLLVEDDDAIAEPLAVGLGREGFDVRRACTGAEALADGDADIVLLDLGLPDLDGAEVCRRLRARSAVPIIVLTARGEELDRVLLLETGADDYVVKPFGFRELVARIRAVLRRAAGPPPADGAVTTLGPLEVDRRRRRVVLDGHEIALTAKEFDLLAYLATDPGAVLAREQILRDVWDPHWWGPTKTLDVHVASLRRKLGDARWIRTVRGVGYTLEVPGTP